MRPHAPFLPLILAAALSGPAAAARIDSVQPRGEVDQVRQVTVRFAEPVVPMGDPRQPAPVALSCNGAPPAGSGRWSDDRVWLFDLQAPLPPGTRCTVRLQPGWRPGVGSPTVEGPAEFGFSTGGPAVVQVRPWPGSEVEEDAHFLLTLTGPATPASVTARAACEVEGIGERLPVRIVDGALREQVLTQVFKGQRRKPAASNLLLLACQRPLPAQARLRLVWGPGIAAAINPQVVTRQAQRFEFTVRARFSADFSCPRERADAGCLPLQPMVLNFSAPVPRAQAQAVRLQPAQGAARAPRLDPGEDAVTSLQFAAPLPPDTRFTLTLPAGLQDDSGRALANAQAFPLAVATGAMPPLAKFAAAPFGIVELEGTQGVLPLTLRHVQPDLLGPDARSRATVKRLDAATPDAELLRWLGRIERYHDREISAKDAGLPRAQWTERVAVTDDAGRTRHVTRDRRLATRTLPLLADEAGTTRLALPPATARPLDTEVIGLPLAGAGYHVVEIASPTLGEKLLAAPRPMFVRTGVLVTNLGVHFKHGRESSAVWVTTLDRGRPVAEAQVAVSDCRGRPLWQGRTDAQGIARIAVPLPDEHHGSACLVDEGLFVTARQGGDLSWVFGRWNRGIEPWRFNLPTGEPGEPEAGPDLRAHTVFDRTLLRAGDTVSMKHFMRRETARGLQPLEAADRPTALVITHVGSNARIEQPVAWQAGGRHALSQWAVPRTAKLGLYEVALQRGERQWPAGSFRVEAFRVPLVDARLGAPPGPLVAPQALPMSVQLTHLSGGGVAGAPVQLSALLRERGVDFPGYEDYSFQPPREPGREDAAADEDTTPDGARLVADKLAATTDAQGAARITIDGLPPSRTPTELVAELRFDDPNGEVQTASQRLALWPAAVVVGVRARSWAASPGQLRFQAVALDTAGRPLAGRTVEVAGRRTQWISSRKRLVGGFYAYDQRREVKALGTLCTGRSDARGLVLCEATLAEAGEVELVASAKDDAGRTAQAATSVWITGQGEFWFAQDNDDRIDLLPEQRSVAPGGTARLQVRMPFREATALVAVEREGVLHTQVVALRGAEPVIEVPIPRGAAAGGDEAGSWAPNVYVSVLALRGRLREVPWYSFFRWGWRAPVDWWRAYRHEAPDWRPPAAMVDLAKPAYKFGATQLQVGLDAHRLDVQVSADQPQYQVRQTAKVKVRVTQGGQPLAGTSVAFAAVDEGLLALQPNTSWDLLGAMFQPRPWSVQTATAQGEVIGRRHYGRKAVPAGGGGGRNPTRELFDTLLLWRGDVQLDARGEASIEVPLNDSLTSFRLVAVADAGTDRFGSGSTQVRVSQDLQMLSGLPPLAREGDSYNAVFTLRNTTSRAMEVQATLKAAGVPGLEARSVSLPAGGAAEVVWPVTVPAGVQLLAWEAAVAERGGAARDQLRITQSIAPAVPLRVMQATLTQLDGTLSVPLAAPADALPAHGPKAGGVQIALQPRLSAELPGLRRFFEAYPYSCLEQRASVAIGLRDATRWQRVVAELPDHLDSDGLALYFPPAAGDAPRGHDRLTAYLVQASHEAALLDPRFALPASALEPMLQGLAAFVEGRLTRSTRAPRPDLDVRKLAAIEALSRHGRASARMLGSIAIAPAAWPTAALIDWLQILQRVEGVPGRAQRLDEARQLLRARLAYSGTTLRFSTEDSDGWWWLMDSADANAARLVLALLEEPSWRAELPRLVTGALARQQGGAWRTTPANLWGSLALDRFSAAFEGTPVAGRTAVRLGAESGAFDWALQPAGGALSLAWPEGAPATLELAQQGSGRPWATLQALAAVPLKAPVAAGYRIGRSIVPVAQKTPGRWSRGDLLRVRLELQALGDMGWVVVSDPLPTGATVLGGGGNRDSQIATRGERREGGALLAYVERAPAAWRAYHEWMPRGTHLLEYTLRLNSSGRFALPPTRVEAMYAPEVFGEVPNETLEVQP
ncbi:MG2 domain-containing protein [Aquincola sp. MAHUQ-54]|uniref:MG2 domain-containing protein n=1 Tax=Aquincola agrisoli TaxID=3119538 RepID=A0AAW9QJI3_9BURK